MNFHLQFPVLPFKEKLTYSHRSIFIGSCFAENMGDLFHQYKFDTIINPHGILYNPLSLATALRRYIDNKPMEENELFFANECWNSWEHHSRFSSTGKNHCLENINKNISVANEYIKSSEWLFITFGSAFIYTFNKSGQMVGNCHKLPQKEFTKRLLSTEEILKDYGQLIRRLKMINNKLKIVFTVSPVRYIRDGVVENTISKARLIEAVHKLVAENENTFYFPAFELVIDDLRDYRFYKEDLVHPNEQATAYVFERLIGCLFSVETNQLFGKVKDIVNAQSHKPFHPDTNAYRKFKATYLERCKMLQNDYPFLYLKNEIEYFSN